MPFRSPSALREQLAEHDAHVFDGVVLIHVEIAVGLQRQVEAAVLGEQLQHVVEEADAGRDVVPAAAFDLQRAADAGLFRVALDGGFSCIRELFELVDVVDDGVRRPPPGRGDRGRCARMDGAAIPMKRHSGGAGSARVVDGVADVESGSPDALSEYASRPSGAGLCVRRRLPSPITGSKCSAGAKRFQREVGLFARTAGEDRERECSGQPLEQCRAWRPTSRA